MTRRNSKRPSEEDAVSRTRNHQKYSDDIYEIYNRRCWLCARSGADTIDHVVPVLWGGSDHPSNLKPAHRSCNSSKGASKPQRKCWTVPPMWLDGYGPRSRDEELAYPRPQSLSPFAFILFLAINISLIWIGIRFDNWALTISGGLLIVFLVLAAYLRWWWWNFTRHRLLTAAKADSTPEDPGEWLYRAKQRPPGLRQIGDLR